MKERMEGKQDDGKPMKVPLTCGIMPLIQSIKFQTSPYITKFKHPCTNTFEAEMN